MRVTRVVLVSLLALAVAMAAAVAVQHAAEVDAEWGVYVGEDAESAAAAFVETGAEDVEAEAEADTVDEAETEAEAEAEEEEEGDDAVLLQVAADADADAESDAEVDVDVEVTQAVVALSERAVRDAAEHAAAAVFAPAALAEGEQEWLSAAPNALLSTFSAAAQVRIVPVIAVSHRSVNVLLAEYATALAGDSTPTSMSLMEELAAVHDAMAEEEQATEWMSLEQVMELVAPMSPAARSTFHALKEELAYRFAARVALGQPLAMTQPEGVSPFPRFRAGASQSAAAELLSVLSTAMDSERWNPLKAAYEFGKDMVKETGETLYKGYQAAKDLPGSVKDCVGGAGCGRLVNNGLAIADAATSIPINPMGLAKAAGKTALKKLAKDQGKKLLKDAAKDKAKDMAKDAAKKELKDQIKDKAKDAIKKEAKDQAKEAVKEKVAEAKEAAAEKAEEKAEKEAEAKEAAEEKAAEEKEAKEDAKEEKEDKGDKPEMPEGKGGDKEGGDKEGGDKGDRGDRRGGRRGGRGDRRGGDRRGGRRGGRGDRRGGDRRGGRRGGRGDRGGRRGDRGGRRGGR